MILLSLAPLRVIGPRFKAVAALVAALAISEGFGTGTGFDAAVVGLLVAGPRRVLEGGGINDDLLGGDWSCGRLFGRGRGCF